MATTVGNILRLSRAGFVLAQHGVRFVPAGTKLLFALLPPPRCHAPRSVFSPGRFAPGSPRPVGLQGAITSLGPSYIKLGQFLATRAAT